MSLVKCKECGEKVSTKAKVCPKCGSPAPKKTSLVAWLVLLFIVYVLFDSVNMSPVERARLVNESAAREVRQAKEEAVEKENEIEQTCKDTTMAFIISQRYVKKQLKSPSTAEFPRITNDGVTTKYIGNCTHEIWGFVDATNSFGAELRSDYYVKIQNKKGTDSWTPLDFKM